MAVQSPDHETILRAIEAWPIEEQITLARTILERTRMASSDQSVNTPEFSTWDALYGIASSGQEPPTDEQVEQWLDERRMEKYGR